VTSLLTRPPEEASRLIALTLLVRVEAAAERLRDGDDDEALHDFRVALRRLRSVLRAYREPLRGSVKKRHRRSLRDLARATGPGRDAEVAAAWIGAQRDALSEEQRHGAEWLMQRYAARRGHGRDEVVQRLDDELEAVAGELRQALGVYTRQVRLEGEARQDSFGELVGCEARRDLERLLELLAAIETAQDGEAVHRARLAAKRLRYLLEPLAPSLAAIEPILVRLRRLQDLLGELNDARVLTADLASVVETAARERARTLFAAAVSGEGETPEARDGWEPVQGLLRLAQRNRERRDVLFAELAAGWLGGGEGEGGEAAGAPDRGEERRRLAAAVVDLVGWLEVGFSPPPPASAESVPEPVR